MLSSRALNRALLERQLLLRRRRLPVLEALERLVGMQAQLPRAPYVGLLARLDGFHPDRLSRLVTARAAVRLALMRSTIHLVSAGDCLALRPVVQPVLDRELARSAFGRNLDGIDLEALRQAARALLEEQPLTPAALGQRLRRRWPDRDPASLAYAARNLLALVQVPPRGLWDESGATTCTTAESWLGRPFDPQASLDRLILRYLEAFGPASVADLQAWSGLTGLRAAVDGLRPRLRTFADSRKRELFDLPDGPLPDEDTPAPPRFLPDFDNALLSHADRSRILPEAHRARLMASIGRPAVLIDGFARAFWKVERQRAAARLIVEPVERLGRGERAAVVEEGVRLLAFLAGDAAPGEVRFAPAP